MKRLVHRILAALIVGLPVAMAPQAANAQLLKKLGQGLEKAGKALDAVAPSDKTTPKKAGQGSAEGMFAGGVAVNGSTARFPYIDGETKLLMVDKGLSGSVLGDISPVAENLFSVKRDGRFEVWNVNGTRVFDNSWTYCGGNDDDPVLIFNGGVAAARDARPRLSGKGPVCLLYADGTYKELAPEVERVTAFKDGVAVVEDKRSLSDVRYYYINQKGEPVFENIKLRAFDCIRPLKDGLRAYPYKSGNDDLWGYMDANGNHVLGGFYAARDFNEGYAWVRRANDASVELIDTSGKTVFKPEMEFHLNLVGNQKLSDVHDGIVRITGDGGNVFYFTALGQMLGTFDKGTDFYGGYALAMPAGADNVVVIDTQMKSVKEMGAELFRPNDLDGKIKFEPFGLATFWGKNLEFYVMKPDGEIILTEWSKPNGMFISGFGQFSESGYAFLDNIKIDYLNYKALMAPDGHLVWLFSQDARSKSAANWPGIAMPAVIE